MLEHYRGYIAAASWGWPRWANPWPLWFGREREAWDAGFAMARADQAATRLIAPVLEPECARPPTERSAR
jgi:hypothetical protein